MRRRARHQSLKARQLTAVPAVTLGRYWAAERMATCHAPSSPVAKSSNGFLESPTSQRFAGLLAGVERAGKKACWLPGDQAVSVRRSGGATVAEFVALAGTQAHTVGTCQQRGLEWLILVNPFVLAIMANRDMVVTVERRQTGVRPLRGSSGRTTQTDRKNGRRRYNWTRWTRAL